MSTFALFHKTERKHVNGYWQKNMVTKRTRKNSSILSSLGTYSNSTTLYQMHRDALNPAQYRIEGIFFDSSFHIVLFLIHAHFIVMGILK
jgi:hypothetical protein